MEVKYIKHLNEFPILCHQMKTLWQACFHDSEGFAKYYFDEKVMDNIILYLENQTQILSMLHLNPYQIALNHHVIDTYYIVGVGTDDRYRGKGYMRRLLIEALKSMYTTGIGVAFLMPADERIYHDFGFFFTEKHLAIEIDTCKKYMPADVSYDIKKLQKDDFSDLVMFYEEFCTHKDYYIKRDQSYYERVDKELASETGEIIGFYKGQQLIGYCMLNVLETSIDIRELIYNQEYVDIILHYIYYSLMKPIKIHYIMNNHFIEILETYFMIRVTNRPYMMKRIVNPMVIGQYIRGHNLCFIMEVIDSVLETSNVYQCKLGKNQSLITITDQIAELKLDIAALSQWWFGYISIEELFYSGRITCSIETLAILKDVTVFSDGFINEIV